MGTYYQGRTHVFKYFRNDASREMNVNGAANPQSFRVTCSEGTKWSVHRLLIHIASRNLSRARFGRNVLDNGLTIKHKDVNDQVVLDFLDGETIKTIGEFSELAGTDSVISDDSFTCRWTIANAGGPLHMCSRDYLEVLVQDNLADLATFRIQAQGMTRR